MSAVKQLFNRVREVKLLKQQQREQRRTDRINKIKQQEDLDKKAFEEEFSEADSVLRTGYFDSEEYLIEYVWELEQDVFEKIMENKETYPEYVREFLINTFDPPKLATGKIRLVELTDDDMDRMEFEKEQEFDKQFELEWQKYKKEKGISRPETETDDKYTELYEDLQTVKNELDTELKKPSVGRKYVTPAMRGKVTEVESPEILKLKEKIKNIENEIIKVKKEIKQEEDNWENEKRIQLSSEIINKVFGM